jgi:uncharacterized protein (DUF983 family)
VPEHIPRNPSVSPSAAVVLLLVGVFALGCLLWLELRLAVTAPAWSSAGAMAALLLVAPAYFFLEFVAENALSVYFASNLWLVRLVPMAILISFYAVWFALRP